MSDGKKHATIRDITRRKVSVAKATTTSCKITRVIARITRHKYHSIIVAMVARQNDAIICAIVTRQKRVTKAIMREMREIRRIFDENELCLYR